MNYSLNVKSSSIVHTLLSNCVKLLRKVQKLLIKCISYSVISKLIRVVSPKFYTARTNFTGPPVPTVPTNFKSGWLVTLFSDRGLLLLSFAIWVQHTKVPNLGVVSGFSDSQLLLLSVLHNTATEQNTETLVFAVQLSQTETATAVFTAVLPQPHCT